MALIGNAIVYSFAVYFAWLWVRNPDLPNYASRAVFCDVRCARSALTFEVRRVRQLFAHLVALVAICGGAPFLVPDASVSPVELFATIAFVAGIMHVTVAARLRAVKAFRRS